MTFDQLAKQVFDFDVKYYADADLPRPNIYWATVSGANIPTLHGYVAGDHTLVALRNFSRYCAEVHDVHPRRSDSKFQLRRLKLGDLLENPCSFQAALDTARIQEDHQVVAALELLPEILARQLGIPVPVDADVAWQRVCEQTPTPAKRQLRA